MLMYGYNNYEAIDKETRQLADEQQVLGQLHDGTYEVDVVEIRGVGTGTYELTLRHGQHIHVSHVNGQVYRLLQWATNFKRPSGGQAIVTLKGNKVTSVSRHEWDGETA